MRARLPKPVLWGAAIGVTYCALVVLAYAVGPARSPGCGAGGGGQITAANGDASSFRGLAATPPPRGAELYRDLGPVSPFALTPLGIAGMTCGAGASSATITGQASVSGRTLRYRIDLTLGASTGGQDTYRIRLSNGYDSGARAITRADVLIQSGASSHRHRDLDSGASS